jgi:hypothetical protein
MNPYRCMGAMGGGLTPLTEPLPGCIPPRREPTGYQERSLAPLAPRGRTQEGNPSGVVPRVILPRWPPLILGLLGFARSTSRSLPILTDFSDFLGRSMLSHSRSFVHIDYLFTWTTCFFVRNRPLEESPHRSCRALRGEVDSSVPRVFGGF